MPKALTPKSRPEPAATRPVSSTRESQLGSVMAAMAPGRMAMTSAPRRSEAERQTLARSTCMSASRSDVAVVRRRTGLDSGCRPPSLTCPWVQRQPRAPRWKAQQPGRGHAGEERPPQRPPEALRPLDRGDRHPLGGEPVQQARQVVGELQRHADEDEDAADDPHGPTAGAALPDALEPPGDGLAGQSCGRRVDDSGEQRESDHRPERGHVGRDADQQQEAGDPGQVGRRQQHG